MRAKHFTSKQMLLFLLLVAVVFSVTACCLPHEWKAASCTEPSTCIKCGKTEGVANGHSWQEATCTAPQTCSVCKATQGEASGHSFIPMDEHQQTCSTCQITTGINFDDVQLNTPYIIDGIAEVEFVSCEFVGSYYEYRKGYSGSSTTETVPSYKKQPMATNGKWYKYITKSPSDAENDYLVLQFNVKNAQKEAVDFTKVMSVSLKHKGRYVSNQKGSIYQQDRKGIDNPFGSSEYVRVSYYSGEEYAVSPTRTGMYMIAWRWYNSEKELNDGYPLSVELTIDGKTMTYHIHK